MPRAGSGQVSITIKRPYAARFHEVTGKKITVTLVYQLMDEALEYKDAMRMAPLKFVEAVDDEISILNRKTGVSATIRIKEGELVCELDHSKNCAHIGFAWGVPAVYKVMKEHGSKPPKQ